MKSTAKLLEILRDNLTGSITQTYSMCYTIKLSRRLKIFTTKEAERLLKYLKNNPAGKAKSWPKILYWWDPSNKVVRTRYLNKHIKLLNSK